LDTFQRNVGLASLTIEPASGDIKTTSGAGDAGKDSRFVSEEVLAEPGFACRLCLEELSARAVAISNVLARTQTTSKRSVILSPTGRAHDTKSRGRSTSARIRAIPFDTQYEGFLMGVMTSEIPSAKDETAKTAEMKQANYAN
jgi:hypothetical protein